MNNGKVDYNRLKVLIVDDLHEWGVNQIFEVPSGEEADVFMETAFDMVNLILCDWNMSGKSGLDILKKAKDLNPRVPTAGRLNILKTQRKSAFRRFHGGRVPVSC